jgi:carotenoid 1,2-hydratase
MRLLDEGLSGGRGDFRRPTGPASAIDRVALLDGPPGSYQWWYFDAQSDDGRFSIVAIYFVGGVFSALYADRLAAGIPAAPSDHPMLNFALYDRGRKKIWVFSEYPKESLTIRDPELDVGVGASSVKRERDGSYTLEIEDNDFVARKLVKATVRFIPQTPGLAPPEFALSNDGRHFWGSPAPGCRVEFRSESHGLRFSGQGYHDVNLGTEPLHAGWRQWSWGRAHIEDETRIYYDAEAMNGERTKLVLTGRNGRLSVERPESVADGQVLTPWLLRPPKRIDAGALNGAVVSVETTKVLESSPFYQRQLSAFTSGNVRVQGIGEYVDLTRFARPAIRFMLRHRIYRRASTRGAPLPAQIRRQQVFPHDPV